MAEIADEALLGIDILQSEELGGPADILLSQNIIKMSDVSIPCFQIGFHEMSRRVTAADHHVIPAMSEIIIHAFVERKETDDEIPGDFIIEPSEHFKEDKPLIMAESIVNINRTPTVQVRVMNPTNMPVSIKQDAVIAQAEPFNSDKNLLAVLEVNYHQNSHDSEDALQVETVDDHHTAVVRQVQPTNIDTLPSYMTPLSKEAYEGCPESEKTQVKSLLLKHLPIFSKDDTDLGLTHLAEHRIETGDAFPIKQRARHEPLAFAGEEKKAIEQLERQGVIRKSSSPWSSPVVLVRKRNGKVRTCVDYRRLNSITKCDAFPLPRT